VDEAHGRYLAAIKELFETDRTKLGYNDVRLELV
jgi:hypothetical protein